MKKLTVSILFTLIIATAVYASDIQPADLIFKPQGEGKYIYCNNEEAIWLRDLSDNSNPNPSYIMNNDDLKAGKYSLFVSHINHTEKYENGIVTQMGFEIEMDTQFVAREDSKIKITAVGFDTQRVVKYSENGKLFKEQSPWDIIQAWADYKQLPIYTINSFRKFYPNEFTPVEVDIKAGEEVWLSRFIYNYSAIEYLKFAQILADFEIIEGSLDVNIAALKHNGTLRDRSHHSKNAERGKYYRDRQYKGIADTLPSVNAELSYTIDDSVKAGEFLPVKVFNQYNKQGNIVDKWFTNINPQEDIWARNSCAESDMLSLQYYDGEKLKYYDASITKRNPLWVFDVFHSDTKESKFGLPNYELSPDVNNIGSGCNLGNYGVSTNCKITVCNKGKKTRYINYAINSNSTNIVIVKDSDGNITDRKALRKNAGGDKTEDIMASVEIPANTTTTFYIEQTLPSNFPGGMENSLTVSDTKFKPVFTEINRVDIVEKYYHTGKEYYKFESKKLYFSEDAENWQEKELSAEAKAIFEGHWGSYEIKYFDGVYVARWYEYDNAPFFYKDAPDCNRVCFFDESFNLITTHYYEGYPSDVFYKDGKIITTVEQSAFETSLPNLEKTITVKLSGKTIAFDVKPVIESGRTLIPVRALFENMGANVMWDEGTKTVTLTKDKQTIKFTIDSKKAYINSNEKNMDVPARQIGFRTLVPLRFLSENLGYSVMWDDITKTVCINQN